MEYSFVYESAPRRPLLAPSELASGTLTTATIKDLTRRAVRINMALAVHERHYEFLARITRATQASVSDPATAAAAGTFLYHEAPAALRRLHRDIDAAFATPAFPPTRADDDPLFLPFGDWEWLAPARHDDLTLHARYRLTRQSVLPLTQLVQFVRYNRVYTTALVTMTYEPGTQHAPARQIASTPNFLSNRK